MHKRELVTQPTDPSYRLIPLTQGKAALVDAADYDWLSQWKWQASFRRTFYAARSITRKPLHYTIQMHRLILAAPKGQLVDHINHDTLDNRRCNLRLADYQQNARNRRLSIKSTSGMPGITWNKKLSKWIAQIGIDRKERKHLGCFDSAEDAKLAYEVAARQAFADFYHPAS